MSENGETYFKTFPSTDLESSLSACTRRPGRVYWAGVMQAKCGVRQVPYPKGKKRDPITKTSLSVRLSVTRLYLMIRVSQIVEIFTDDVLLLPL
ncbi:hypothetical protein EVAR_81329_1 [Eumeta japonica]|uniref:Uncharacterized protein n=1 Tax=Eumeta variegata TaxID=151549 RepID=A0A4C1W025_EUMVA|nr:hypothetical protein EVAR_81329_1 [Eumeta japonica]